MLVHDRLTVLTLLILLCVGCSNVNLDVTPTPSLVRLRVELGGNAKSENWESLSAEREQLQSDLVHTLERLESAGYRSTWNARKSWPWPIQTQVAKQLKDLGSIDAKLLYLNSPTPLYKPIPTRPPRSVLQESWGISPNISRPILTPTPTPTQRILPTVDRPSLQRLHQMFTWSPVPTETFSPGFSEWLTGTPTPTPTGPTHTPTSTPEPPDL